LAKLYFDGLPPVVEIVDDGSTTLTKRHRSVPGALGNVLQTYDGTANASNPRIQSSGEKR